MPGGPASAGPLRVEGYVICGCGRHVLEHVAHLTEGVCLECFLNGTGRYLRDAEVAHRSRTVSVSLSSRVKRGPKKSKKTKHTVEHAKRRAFRLLRSWVPDLWDIAYAIERERGGLPPLPLRRPPGAFARTVATYAENGVYPVADPGGVSGATRQEGASTD